MAPIISEGKIGNVFRILSVPISVICVIQGYLWGGTEKI
jgi:hypothetical protein